MIYGYMQFRNYESHYEPLVAVSLTPSYRQLDNSYKSKKHIKLAKIKRKR